jgi:hypothetical protein
MNPAHWQDTASADAGDIARKTHVVAIVSAVALATALALGGTLTAGNAEAVKPIEAPAAQPDDPSPFILNALLVPALDPDVSPLQWVDPRPLLGCGPDTTVRVNNEPLVAGGLVPDVPFELEWHADNCRYLGAPQARFDGDVKLTVHREDWGFSATVEPAKMLITRNGT